LSGYDLAVQSNVHLATLGWRDLPQTISARILAQ
jgi:hypothetical protein